LLRRNFFAARWRHGLQLSFYLNNHRFYQGYTHGTMLWYQKERVWNHTQHSGCLHDPRRPCLPNLSFTQFRPLIIPQYFDCPCAPSLLHTTQTSDNPSSYWLP
jgi:hypothetical protein